MSYRLIVPALLLATLPLGNVSAAPADITITDPWIRALPSSVPSGGYFTLHNGGAKAVTLTGATSPGCGMLMLHRSENTGGMTNMQDVTKVDVPAGGTFKFSPGGYHLMCMNANSAIQPGKTVLVTLEFSDGAKITSHFVVKSASGN